MVTAVLPPVSKLRHVTGARKEVSESAWYLVLDVSDGSEIAVRITDEGGCDNLLSVLHFSAVNVDVEHA